MNKKEVIMQTKSMPFLLLKEMDDNEGIVSFYFSSFDNEDSDGDITLKGAFSKTIKECRNRLKHFRNHLKTEACGVITDIGEDSKGAWATSKLALKTMIGGDTYEQYKAGLITEHSFGYDVINDERVMVNGQEKRYIKEYRLWEVSSLTHWGANELTPTIGVKSISDYLNTLDRCIVYLSDIKNSKNKDYKLIQEKSIQLYKLINTINEPDDTTLKDSIYRFEQKLKSLNI